MNDGIPQEVMRFVKAHLVHVVLLPVMAIAVTLVHESAHSLAAIAQGGTVTDFVVLPSDGHWGFMRYAFPTGHAHSAFAISIAPYVLWLVIAMITCTLGLRTKPFSPTLRSWLFVWGYVVPLGDIANAAVPYLGGAENDFRSALGAPTSMSVVFVTLAFFTAVAVGFPLQQKLYRESRLGAGAYAALIVLFCTGLGVLWAAF